MTTDVMLTRDAIVMIGDIEIETSILVVMIGIIGVMTTIIEIDKDALIMTTGIEIIKNLFHLC